MTKRFFHNGQCRTRSRNCRRGVLAACSCCLARVLFRHRIASSLHMVPQISSSSQVSCTPTPGLQGPYGRWAEWQPWQGLHLKTNKHARPTPIIASLMEMGGTFTDWITCP